MQLQSTSFDMIIHTHIHTHITWIQLGYNMGAKSVQHRYNTGGRELAEISTAQPQSFSLTLNHSSWRSLNLIGMRLEVEIPPHCTTTLTRIST